MTSEDKARLRTLTHKLMAITGFTEKMCKTALWVEYQDSGLNGAESYVDRAVSNKILNELAMQLVNAGYDDDDVLDSLYESWESGGDLAMKTTAQIMLAGAASVAPLS